MEPFRNARPVLTVNDMALINEGLYIVRSKYGDEALRLAKAGDHEPAGHTLAAASEVDDLINRFRTLINDIVNETIDTHIAEGMDEVQRLMDESLPTDEPPTPTDEVGTVPLDELVN